MKFNKFIIGLGAVLLAASVSAQTFDVFSATRTYVLSAPKNFGAATGAVTNGPVDHIKLLGRVKVDFMAQTNTAGGTLSATVYTSPDQTNLTALANYAIISAATTDSLTNLYYGTNGLVANNSVLFPGTMTTPTTSSGFVTPYLATLPFTNSGAITLIGAGNTEIGFNITDQPRYIYVVYTPGGTATNITAGAILTGTPSF
jgi:hypothetical protein